MASTTYENGRLCNQIFRNVAVSLIAEKFNLKVDYANREMISRLGIPLFSGEKEYATTTALTDQNYFSVYHANNWTSNIDPNANYFQTVYISHFLYSYLTSEPIKPNIMSNNPFRDRYNNNRDAYVHIRLGDADRHNPGSAYYIHVLRNLSFDRLYISTDSPEHPITQELSTAYPNAILVEIDEVSTIQLASTCKYVVLSHGSFSATIGYLAFYSEVHYPEYGDTMWHGDIFSIDTWIKHVKKNT